MNLSTRVLANCGAVILLMGCSTPEPSPTFSQLRFGNLEPVAIGAMSAEVMDQSISSRLPPNVEHLSLVSFRDAVISWSKARFAPNGVGSIRFVTAIEEASLKEKPLTLDGGVRGVFKKEQAVEYEARLGVVVRAIATNGQVVAEARASAWQTRTLLEGATTEDVQALLFEMVETTVMAMDKQMLAEISKHFSAYIL